MSTLLRVKCLTVPGLLKLRWLRIKLVFGTITLTKFNHSASKSIDDPREVRLIKLCRYRLKDVDGRVMEVDLREMALTAEFFEGVANSVHHSIKLLRRQISRHRSCDASCQIRQFGLHVEGYNHHFASFWRAGLPTDLLCSVLWRQAIVAPLLD